MLYNLLVPLADDYTIFNVFRYITFRSGALSSTLGAKMSFCVNSNSYEASRRSAVRPLSPT